jgi:hypothetical protein
MKNFSLENLTELSANELTEVQGGGLLTNVLATATAVVLNLPGVTHNVNGTLKNLVDYLI